MNIEKNIEQNPPRSYFTRKAIAEAFIQIAEKKEINKITTVELCREAGINRNTFYSHYYSVDEVFNELKALFFEEIDQNFADNIKDNSGRLTISVFRTLYKHKELSKIIFLNESNKNVVNEIFDRYRNELQQKLYDYAPGITEKEKLLLFNYIKCGITGTIVTWLSNEYTFSPDDVSKFLKNVSCYGVTSFNSAEEKL